MAERARRLDVVLLIPAISDQQFLGVRGDTANPRDTATALESNVVQRALRDSYVVMNMINAEIITTKMLANSRLNYVTNWLLKLNRVS